MKNRSCRLQKLAACVLIVMAASLLAGCVIKFVMQGTSSYIIMPNGDILDGSMQKGDMMMDVAYTGSKLTEPWVLAYEMDALFMGDANKQDSAAYIACALGAEGYYVFPSEDRFRVYGELEIMDFWTAMGITGLAELTSPQTIPLSDIIGSVKYQALVDCIVYVEGLFMSEGSTIDIELRGDLKSSTGRKLGTFMLWMDGIRPQAPSP